MSSELAKTISFSILMLHIFSFKFYQAIVGYECAN
nr:MAG TPA: hypothetical protein [Caudoviricetes sp.]DAK26064.1 MAG TPA: hypothetical protein [Caudoviricetes sp.]DAT02419.1 MAG TPA: hypothetical protein [Caudoviricetes sp.]